MSSLAQNPLSTDVGLLHGVGRERAAQLGRLGLRTVEDLLHHRPRRYEDRRHFLTISQLAAGEPATIRGKVQTLGVKRWRHGSKSLFELILDDGTARLHCRWWNLPFMENYFRVGDDVLAFGKLSGTKPRTMDHPETEVLEAGEDVSIHMDRTTPIYPLTEGLPQRWLRSLIWRALQSAGDSVSEKHPGIPVPKQLQALPSRAEALRRLHFPESVQDAERARLKLAFDEFLDLQQAIQLRRRALERNARALPCAGNNRLIKTFLKELGFKLTDAQTAVLRQIRKDMGGKVPMRRLLQGDVGSGKTAVAACTALMVLESGFNVALMAPTEILAGQHFQNFQHWMRPLGIEVGLRTGTTAPSRSAPSHLDSSRGKASSAGHGAGGEAAEENGNPSPTLWIGTHALIQQSMEMERLGLVIIDEQHKFGVAQREALVRKGVYPHLLVMTATPIPRTLGLTLYGDLDNSVIDASPPGRGPIKTFIRTGERLPQVWDFVRAQIASGRQAYLVCPRVENDPAAEIRSAEKEFEKAVKTFAPAQVGLLHGRVPASQKEKIMEDFRSNRIRVLVATSVIEVGVDVPNATVMVVENAEQFGLAQLHQLRGRIGRGRHESYCILMARKWTAETQARLRTLEETADGFRVAEEDLRQRGPGELLGQSQSGLPRLRFADLVTDRELLELARAAVRENLNAK